MARETFKAAKERLLREFSALGWEVHTRDLRTFKQLKVPYAEQKGTFRTPHGQKRVWLKPQAAYAASGLHPTLNSARSLTEDYRGTTASELVTTGNRLGLL